RTTTRLPCVLLCSARGARPPPVRVRLVSGDLRAARARPRSCYPSIRALLRQRRRDGPAGYPSGQRGLTVNQLALPTGVRIPHPPPQLRPLPPGWGRSVVPPVLVVPPAPLVPPVAASRLPG